MGVRRMQGKWTVHVFFGLLGSTLGGLGSQGPNKCSMQCAQVYSLHTAQYEQVLPSLQACQQGCQFFSEIETKNGFQDALSNLETCNYSCKEQTQGVLVPACQSGCGFHFDNDVTERKSSPPPPTFTRGASPPPPPPPPFPVRARARGSLYPPQSPPPPRPTVIISRGTPRSSPLPSPIATSGPNPLFNILRSGPGPVLGPVMVNRQRFNATPQRLTFGGEIPPQAGLVTKENPRGPTIIGFNIPQLLSKVQSILPSMEQALPRIQQQPRERLASMDISMQPQERKENNIRRPNHLEFSLPSVERMFSRIGDALPDLEREMEPIVDRVMGIEIGNPFQEFVETPRMSIPRIPDGLFGVKDSEEFGFNSIFDELTNHMSSQFSRTWSPFGKSQETGKLTVIKAGPGYHEEQHFDIRPDGKLIEITESPMHKDALEHENPMDVHFDSNDVEIFNPEEKMEAESGEEEKDEISEPVMDVWAIEENGTEKEEKEKEKEEKQDQKNQENEDSNSKVETNVNQDDDLIEKEEKEDESPEALPQVKVSEFSVKEYPFLDVLRNTVEENERMSQQLPNRYRSLADREYRDDYTCNSEHLKWSEWVACLHAKVGVPRWLTAATISLGIVFSVWLCLVIPSSAPKQRLRALVIKAEKPSAAVAKAKEVEAAAAAAAKAKEAEAAGFDAKDYVVAVVNVDMPPTYGDWDSSPGSPAPSYKSDMAPPVVPGSPAPSYKSVDIPVEKTDKSEKVNLEPVHEKKESNA